MAAATREPTAAGPQLLERPKGELPFWVVLSGLLLLGWLLVRLLSPAGGKPGLSPAVIYALLSLGSLCVGGAVGFLFGIPHTSAASTTDEQGRAVPSTSLEQVADWLTKIIIGVGLVELNKLQARLGALGQLISAAVGDQPTNPAVPQLVAVLFAVLGFLAVYIWTRIYYGGIQSRADADMRRHSLADVQQQVNQNRQQLADVQQQVAQNQQQVAEARQQAQTRLASDLPAPLPKPRNPAGAEALRAVAPSPKTLLQGKLEEFLQAPPDWSRDTSHDLFGEAPATVPDRHRSLDVRPTEPAGPSRRLRLRAEVRGAAGQALRGEVVFVLHPTYLANRVKVVPVPPTGDGLATLDFIADGSFTLYALTDFASDTPVLLSFDLSSLGPGGNW